MTVLQDIYFLTSCLGFIYIVGSALMGGFHSHNGSGHGGHTGAGHGHAGHGHAGHGHAHVHIGHGGGSHGGGSHGGGSHGAGSQHAGSHGHGSGSSSAASHGAAQEDVSNALSVSQTAAVARRTELPEVYLKILDVLNPTKLAFFAFMFGAIGFVAGKFLPGYLSLAPAVVLGWLLANLFFYLMSSVMSRLHSSTNFKKESLIGATGELSLSIESGGIGEIVVRTGNSRYNFPVRSANAEQSIKKLAKVIIVDIKDGIFFVEPFEEL